MMTPESQAYLVPPHWSGNTSRTITVQTTPRSISNLPRSTNRKREGRGGRTGDADERPDEIQQADLEQDRLVRRDVPSAGVTTVLALDEGDELGRERRGEGVGDDEEDGEDRDGPDREVDVW